MKAKNQTLFVFFLTLFFFDISNPVFAKKNAAQHFFFPASCHYGENCWAVNYVDDNPAKGEASDFTCKQKTYDGHKGTDFAIPSITMMKKGVDVLAAADGTVLRVRDGEIDSLKNTAELDVIKKERKECGNGIIINHGAGLQTMYCHLKQSSISVRPGQPVNAGEKIAQIGLSGVTEFPHLHFQVLLKVSSKNQAWIMRLSHHQRVPR